MVDGQYRHKIPDWPMDERPRERLFKYGPETLSEAELIAILLRTGSGGDTAVDMARALLQKFKGLRGLDQQPAQTLSQVKGIGQAKAAQIKAAFELAKRVVQEAYAERPRVRSSEDVYRMVRLQMRDLGREEFRLIFLTGRNEVLSQKRLFEGSLAESVVSPREIILTAIQQAAASVIMIHNHPSGDPEPSPEDRKITQKIVRACHYCDISVLDHLIIGRESYFSFADHGLIESI
jgi:DNA repair protein RadC